MSRRPSLVITKRKSIPEPLYNDLILAKFINNLMYDGKKAVAEKIVYNVFLNLKKEKGEHPLKLFHEAIENVKPYVQMKNIRMGGATYKVPIELQFNRQLMVAIKWIIESARGRPEKTMEKQLTSELLDILKKQGSSIKKRDDLHKLAEANRAFAHFRW